MSSEKKTKPIPSISIIVPVYNTQKYLERCLDSICHQTLKALEIIIINDGSTDNSAAIVRKYAEKDARIIYIEQNNEGLGITRNKGIETASGEYLAFVDSDDYIEPQMMECMYKKAVSENLDVVMCQTMIKRSEGQYLRKKLSDSNPINLRTFDYFDFFRNFLFTNTYSNNAWDKIYRSTFIKDNGIAFGDNKSVFAEDLHFQFHVLLNSPNLNFLPETFCHYIKRDGSITGSMRSDYMSKHLKMVNLFYELSSVKEPVFFSATDVIFFRGLMNEANYSVRYKLGLSFFKNSCSQFYTSQEYKVFMESAWTNKSSKLIAFKKRRMLFKLFLFLSKYKMKRIAECVLYFKFKIKFIVGN